jgi:hypothetical protein
MRNCYKSVNSGKGGSERKIAPGLGWAENRDSRDGARAGVGAAAPVTITLGTELRNWGR